MVDPYQHIKDSVSRLDGGAYWYFRTEYGRRWTIVKVMYDSIADDGSFLCWAFDREDGLDLEAYAAEDFIQLVDGPMDVFGDRHFENITNAMHADAKAALKDKPKFQVIAGGKDGE